MAYYRGSLLFAVTTNPTMPAIASPHSGGWSESHWNTVSGPAMVAALQLLASWRALLLPSEASIIGYRIQGFNISGNKLLPTGSSTGVLNYPGASPNDFNLPQDSLTLGAAGTGVVNASRFNLRCIPDSQISYGEYQPSATYTTAMNAYIGQLISSGWGFIGRNKAGLSARVMSITAGGVVTLNGAVGGLQGTDFLRMVRVYDVNGDPVKGAYQISNIVGPVYTCPNITQLVSRSSGSARIDQLNFFTYASISVQRATSRKIGRPFQQYRGRRSRIGVV